MDCLYAECTPCITDCVMAELEKLGQKYRVALKIAKVGGACPLASRHVCPACFPFWSADAGSAVITEAGSPAKDSLCLHASPRSLPAVADAFWRCASSLHTHHC